MNILFLRGFNNYFNRIVKKYSALADYQNNSSSYINLTGINFNPNDGVATELIVGNQNQKENNAPLDWENIGTPDYCICYESSGTPSVDTIISRWFVLESERTRSGQYRLALKRDVVAEYYSTIMTAPCFVEKGYITDTNNPLLYNKENLTYNQIKVNEYLLKDPTESGWVVGYVAKNFGHTSGLTPGEISADDADPIDYIDEEDLPFTVSTSGSTTVIAADALKTDLNVMLPVAWVDARYGSWGTVYHRRHQSFIIYNSSPTVWTNNATNSNQPYIINDGALTTSTIEQYGYTANSFLAGGTFANISFVAMNSAFALDKVSSGDYTTTTTNINNNLKLNINMSGVQSDPTKISAVIKKYVALPADISGGTFGTASPSLYVDYNKAIGGSAYSQMKNYYSSNYNWSNLMNYYNSKLSTKLTGYNAFIRNNNNNRYITDYNGKIVKISNKYYKMYISFNNNYHVIIYNTSNERMPTYTVSGTNTIQVDTDSSTTSNNYMNNIITSFGNVKDDQNTNLFTTQTSWKAGAGVLEILPKYSVTLEEVRNELIMTGGTSATFTGSEYSQGDTYDAAYDIFAIPYGRIGFKPEGSNTVYYTSKSEGIGIGRWLATALGSNLYDLQILPYCPNSNIRDYMIDESTLDLSVISGHYQLVFRAPPGTSTSSTSSWSPCSFIFTALSCRGTFDINQSIEVPETGYSSALDYKISNETELVRLCSPNWGSMFEFSLAKNNGVSKFNIDFTYKPYAPYIHINPDFKGLYGEDWDDARGLILGGDFSVQSADSAWIEYTNNNKNFQSIFNREIENMDVNNQIALEKANFQGVTGIFSGMIGGGLGGALAGAKAGPYGAIAGAIGGTAMGTALSEIGYIKDMDWLRRQQAEAKDYATDMYGYQLGNIKARPNSLARTDALNNNNKIWPVIEIYNCKTVETNNLINKIRYNGMTIMAIGTLEDYSVSTDFSFSFLKGQLIRINSLQDDFHIADAIYQEVNKGFYIPQGGN